MSLFLQLQICDDCYGCQNKRQFVDSKLSPAFTAEYVMFFFPKSSIIDVKVKFLPQTARLQLQK